MCAYTLHAVKEIFFLLSNSTNGNCPKLRNCILCNLSGPSLKQYSY